jgi:ABC-2 type transport system ATP-binding protein
MSEILTIDNVVKAYEKTLAVNHVSFSMPEGVIFGLLGPNGAGKSSLIRMITTITRPDSGEIYFNGEPLNSRHPEQIGYMPEERGLYKKMKVGDHLMYLAQLKGLSYSQALEEVKMWMIKLDIKDWWGKKVEELSKGMQQKAQFISTVLHRPRLLILDEPFSGLDPVNAEILKNEIYELHKNGTSIIFSTHRMEQVEEICDKIVLINKGQNVLYGGVKEIKQQFKEHIYRIDFEGALPSGFNSNYHIVEQRDGHLKVKLTEGANSNLLLKQMLDAGARITAFNEILPTLNEIFIRQVGAENLLHQEKSFN